jgi:hypothetical protein
MSLRWTDHPSRGVLPRLVWSWSLENEEAHHGCCVKERKRTHSYVLNCLTPMYINFYPTSLTLNIFLARIGFCNVRRVRKIAKSDNELRQVCLPVWSSVRPSARNNSAPTGRIFRKFDIWTFFKNLCSKLKFHSNLTNLTGTLKCHSNLTRITGTLHENNGYFTRK